MTFWYIFKYLIAPFFFGMCWFPFGHRGPISAIRNVCRGLSGRDPVTWWSTFTFLLSPERVGPRTERHTFAEWIDSSRSLHFTCACLTLVFLSPLRTYVSWSEMERIPSFCFLPRSGVPLCCLWVSRTRSRDLARMRLSIFTCSENVNKQRYLLRITRDLLERVNRMSVFTWNKKYHWWEIAS